MKTRYRPHHNKKFLFPGIVLAVLIIGAVFADDLRVFIYKAGQPVWLARESIAKEIDSGFKYRSMAKEDLVEENLSLLAENELLRREGSLLKRELEIVSKGGNFFAENIPARVVLRPPFYEYDFIVADSSRGNEILLGDFVVSDRGAFLGEVSSRTERGFLRIKLSSSPGNSLIAETPSGELVDLVGQGGGSFFLRAPKGMSLNKGDILTESITGREVAVVQSIESDKEDPFNEVFLSLPVNIFSLTEVHLIKKND